MAMSKYDIGDLIACPRKAVEDMWGICIVLGTGSVDNPMKEENFIYYKLYSPTRQNTIQIPEKVVDKHWYLVTKGE